MNYVSFTKGVKSIPLVGISLSRALCREWRGLQIEPWIWLTSMRLSRLWGKMRVTLFHQKSYMLWMKTMFLGSNMHMMMQTLEEADGSCLPHDLTVMNTYTKMTTRNKQSCSCSEELDWCSDHHCQGCQSHLSSSHKCECPRWKLWLETLEKLGEICKGSEELRCWLGRERKHIFQQLELTGLEGWSTKKSSCCMHSANRISWYLFFGTWRVGLHWSGKAWDQGCWWRALQGEIPKNSPSYGGWGPCPCERDVGSGCRIGPSQSPWCNAIVLVHRKDSRSVVLHWLLQIKCEHQERLLSVPTGYKKPLRV